MLDQRDDWSEHQPAARHVKVHRCGLLSAEVRVRPRWPGSDSVRQPGQRNSSRFSCRKSSMVRGSCPVRSRTVW
ncbi:MAG: hypothetical protein ACR2MP_09005 [Streptosporangiaceae bacterium]